MTATVLIFDFPNSAFGPDRTEALKPLAEDIAGQPGLLWKIWTEEPAEGRAGGVYLFATREAAEAYHAMHAARLAARGVTGIEATYRGVNETLSRLDRGPVG
ncbi:YdhR family protein [Falsiroseomonas sp.]|uniref:YdhR family protein n=1 Tax=Falsiroseomonas sp. TaxID=2870721 RepID=UPI0027289260|nr:YdhR family protein [Falsiroseomonas sp.]MDO9499587.1 YdhR family protein [Falsiroseomonas sp.]MDP3415441.1 YdhR family protein [Falsiroseomonas sp.]